MDRRTALDGLTAPRRLGLITDTPGLRVTEAPVRALWQISAWPQRLAAAGAAAARAAGVTAAPGPGRALTGPGGTLMRVEPMRWHLVADREVPRPDLDPGDGTVLDLGHARTRLRLSGPAAVDTLARLMPLDLRAHVAPEGTVATSLVHHLSVTVLVQGGGYDLMVVRGFGQALWEHVLEIGAQFGVEIV